MTVTKEKYTIIVERGIGTIYLDAADKITGDRFKMYIYCEIVIQSTYVGKLANMSAMINHCLDIVQKKKRV